MKKILLLLCALLGTVGTWAYTTVTLGSQVTDLSTLSAEKYYVLKNVGSSKYNCFDGTQMTPTDEVDYSAVVVLNYDGTNVTIKQVNADQYYQGLVNNERLTLGNDPVNYTFNTDGVSEGQFRFANNSLYMNRNGGDEQFPMGAATSFVGNYSRWNIYEVTVIDGYVRTYSISTGSFTSTNAGGTWASAWQSTATEPSFTLTTTVNNIQVSSGTLYPGNSGCTYTITVPVGFLIKGYTIVGQAQTAAQTLTPAAGGSAVEFGTDKAYTLNVTGLSTQTTSFTHSTPNNGIAISSFTVIIDEDPAYNATVQYVVRDANEVELFRSDAIKAIVGTNVTELPSEYQHPYCSYNVTPVTIDAGENTVNVTVSYNLPFTVSTSFAEATWYYATLRGKYLRADDSAKDGSGRFATNLTNEHTDAYKWAFFGNPYAGIYVMNKNQGDGKFLYKPDAQFVFQTVNDPTAQNNTLFEATPNGEDGFTLRSLTGPTLYVNDAGNGGNLGFWNSSAGKTDDGSKWVVEEVPDVAIDVTYELWVGGEKVNTVIDEQVAQNSDVNIPASLTSAYSVLAYDFATEGEIGTENCTITVTGTMKTGVVTALNQLSNAKAYTLTTTRGSLGTNGTQMVSSFGTEYSASNFAIISYEDNLYLYSVADSKWVGNPTTVNSVDNQPALTDDLSSVTAIALDAANATTASPLFFMGMGSNGVNVSNYSTGIVVNSWTTRDPGNQYCIIEAADFDPTDALAALEEFFHPAAESVFNSVIEQLEAINYGTGLGQYGLSGEFTGYESQAATIISGLKTQGYTEDNLTIAQSMLDATSLNMPAGKFIRLYSAAREVYMGTAASGKHPNAASIEDAGIYYVANDGKILSIDQAAYLGSTAGAPCVEAANAGTFTISDAGSGKYYVNCGGYLVAWTSASDRLSSPDDYAVWTITEVEDFEYSVTVSDAGYATLCFPVALTIPEGVTAYTGVVDGKYLKLTALEGTIPAATPVILEAEAGKYSFEPTTAAAFDGSNTLAGTIGKAAVSGILTLQNIDDVAGLYTYTGTSLAGFKAYIDNAGGEVKSLTFRFDTATGINGVSESANSKTIYNLAGQRVNAATKGIYIVNGKKVVIK